MTKLHDVLIHRLAGHRLAGHRLVGRSLRVAGLLTLACLGSVSTAQADDSLQITISATRGIFQDCAKPDFTGCGDRSSRTGNISGLVVYNTNGAHVTGRLLDLPEPIDLLCQANWTKTTITLAGDKAIAECRYLSDQEAQKLRIEINYTLGAPSRSGVIKEVLTFGIGEQSCIVGILDATVMPASSGSYLAQCVAK